jgi:hypothetical protein
MILADQDDHVLDWRLRTAVVLMLADIVGASLQPRASNRQGDD